MKVIVCKDYEEVSDKAAEIMLDVVKSNPKAVLGLATGSSPIGLYQRMIKDHQENNTSYAEITTFNLDEYVGLNPDHPQSYHTFMHENLFNHLDIKKENVNLPSVLGDDMQANCDAYNELLSKYSINLQLLGIGSNGHLAFNEPGTPFDSVTQVVDLVESTIQDNARFFDYDLSKVPTQSITMGIENIMEAEKILLIASGKNKAEAIYQTVKGEVSTDWPASILQRHQDVTVVVDEEAASLL
ncbi:MAG: glucosamine-6-phosphate deaminase [Bacillota bacterium]|nr:glucosamine-6-phosphate deaminase [Bacillota bacterium]NLL26887.1 glucosamine-6-phosphate deaminase [Erysipelotrichia bacterium]